MSNLSRHQEDLLKLISLGRKMVGNHAFENNIFPSADEVDKKLRNEVKGLFPNQYQKWYSEGCAVIEQILPARLSEFTSCYMPDAKRKEVSVLNYVIQDWQLGVRAAINQMTNKKFYDDATIILSRLNLQVNILEACERRFESSLFDIKQLVMADMFDSELDAASELLKHKFSRGAGAIAGVVLEKHLKVVCDNHKIVIKKGHPTISTFNDALKDASVIEVPVWRSIQHLGDLRNLCDHGKGKEPTVDEINDLITGVKKVTKTIH